MENRATVESPGNGSHETLRGDQLEKTDYNGGKGFGLYGCVSESVC